MRSVATETSCVLRHGLKKQICQILLAPEKELQPARDNISPVGWAEAAWAWMYCVVLSAACN